MSVKMNYLNVKEYFGERHSSGVERNESESTGDMNYYRCHLVEDYLAVHKLPDSMKKNIGAGDGIRQALGLIASFYKNKKFLIPSDVYPVYQKILKESGVVPHSEYDTLTVENPYECFENSNDDVLLICDPLKPLGDDVSDQFKHIKTWLEARSDRIVIVDAAYDISLDLKSNYFIQLIEAGYNVIFLHSLTKSWCLPMCFGITIVSPEIVDKVEIIGLFRSLNKNVDNLKKAYIALNKQADIPNKIRSEIIELIIKASDILGVRLPINENSPSYLFKVDGSVEYLSDLGVVAINPSLYNPKLGDFSIISVLDEDSLKG